MLVTVLVIAVRVMLVAGRALFSVMVVGVARGVLVLVDVVVVVVAVLVGTRRSRGAQRLKPEVLKVAVFPATSLSVVSVNFPESFVFMVEFSRNFQLKRRMTYSRLLSNINARAKYVRACVCVIYHDMSRADRIVTPEHPHVQIVHTLDFGDSSKIVC